MEHDFSCPGCKTDELCLVCDGGLSICRRCGQAEADLTPECSGESHDVRGRRQLAEVFRVVEELRQALRLLGPSHPLAEDSARLVSAAVRPLFYPPPELGAVVRASGDALCACGVELRKHPSGGSVVVACDGQGFKL